MKTIWLVALGHARRHARHRLLKPKVRVLCVVCAAENMPSGFCANTPRANVHTALLRPTNPARPLRLSTPMPKAGLSWPTGLTYARQLGATHLIDAARSPALAFVAPATSPPEPSPTDDETWAKFDAALSTSGDKFWRLPLGEEYARDDQERHRRHQEHRRTLGRRNYGRREFSQKSLSKTLPGFTRHRRPGLGGRPQA